MLAMHQVVRVVRDVPEQGVTKGMVGAVVEVFELPRAAFEVEFVDAEGRTVRQATLAEDDLEPVRNGVPGTA
ncbi:MAG: DUF4926 domain-containing protein [Myxococcaceae bacterium]|jgi:hypothetical protein|nr:DUF4926 domain-containing protein [Myxococcaceae bacterium]